MATTRTATASRRPGTSSALSTSSSTATSTRSWRQLDKVVEAAPSYRKLISRWENQGWSSETFDFTRDAEEWADDEMWTDEQRRFMNWMMSSFFIGEERVTTELLPFAIAGPTDDQRIFLASQIADEARHCVFFDRFYREVMNSGTTTIAENLAAERPKMHNEYIELFDGILHDCAENLRKDPSNMDELVRGITVYMIVIEGTLALTGARFILRYLKEADRLPGFRDGFTHVNRDESRHVGFGVKFLCDAIKEDERYRKLDPGDALGDAADRGARVLAGLGREPLRLRHAVRLPLVGDVRVRDALAVEEARGDGDVGRARSPRPLERSRRTRRSARPGPAGDRTRRSGSSRPPTRSCSATATPG